MKLNSFKKESKKQYVRRLLAEDKYRKKSFAGKFKEQGGAVAVQATTAANRTLGGFRGRSIRIQNDRALSRQVLEEAYQLDADITKGKQPIRFR